MTDRDRKIAQQLKLRLSRIVNLVDFRIFGSRAKGTADQYSDMDVFIEVDDISRDLEQKIREVAWETGFENDICVSPFIISRFDIEESPLRSSSIVTNIYAEGVCV